MTPFLAAQADDPFDPAPMLILADALEESGDLIGAGVLRGLAGAGCASLVTLAIGVDLAWPLDETNVPTESGDDGLGIGATDGNSPVAERGCGYGEADRHAGGTTTGMQEGYGQGAGDERRPE